MSEEKTLGQIAREAYWRDSQGWNNEGAHRHEAWERAAKAVALALESADRRTTKCGYVQPTPKGRECPFAFGCTVARWPNNQHIAMVRE